MILYDLLQRLSRSELSNLSIGSDGSGVITDANVPKLLIHINDGLVRLYSRFTLSIKQLMIEEQEHITNYHLLQKYAETSNSGEPYPYIKDLPDDPFLGDVIRVLEVWDENGCERPLNDEGNCHSLFTPYVQTIQIPTPITGKANSVVYQAKHPEIKMPPDANRSQEIILPFVLEGALTAFIAHKVFSNMAGQEHIIKSQEQIGLYESICVDVEDRDLVNTTLSVTTTKLRDRGFV